jgi:bacterioferritin
MASEKLKDLLNQSIAREIQVAVQYMWQHVLWSGIKGFAVKDQIKSIAVMEMRHAEAIAERLNYFGGIPTTKPAPIFVGESLKEMLTQDQKDERGAIKLYNEVIAVAKAENDEGTYKLFQGILADEEDHDDFFTTALEEA